jgi:arsenate reductase (thioredoxin)
MAPTSSLKPMLYSPIVTTIEKFKTEFSLIPDERKAVLKKLAVYVANKVKAGSNAQLIFICTHNSRRSHLSQIWAQTAAAYYGIDGVVTYSGGTEATAFNPRSVKALQQLGFVITDDGLGSTNPVYDVKFADDAPALKAFSKKYDEAGNPTTAFAAIMTCSHADQNCPLVLGAEARIVTPYDDPKDFDGTPQEEEKYSERAHDIGRELVYAFSLIDML